MLKKQFIKSWLLLLCMIVGASSAWADTTYKLTKVTSVSAGNKYVFEQNSHVLSNTLSSSALQTTDTYSKTGLAGSESYIWELESATGGFYLKNVSLKSNQYLNNASKTNMSFGSKTAVWSIAFTDGVALISNTSNDNRFLGDTGQSTYKAYATSNLSSYPHDFTVYLVEEEVAAVTALSVKTAPTKLNYKLGETLDLTGLVLDADGNDVTSGYTASPANDATLNSVGAQTVTFTYGGQTTTQTIHVGDLESIALTTTGVKTTYDEGQTFDPTNLVVTATYSDGEDTPTTWTEDVTASCTYDPDGPLKTTDENVEVSYTLGSTKTANIAITVNAASAYTVTFNAGTGSCGTSSLTEASPKAGVTLPTATIGVTGWSFVGWATASVTNTEDEPTTYAAGATYKPTEDCTLYAVYKFSDVSTTTYQRATSVSDITSAPSVVIVCNNQSKVLDNTLASGVTAPTESSSKITAPEKAIFTLTGDNTDGYILTNGTTTVGASSTDNSTTISNTTSNDLWVVKAHGTSNTFYFENKGKSNLCLEYYKSSVYKWMVYAPATPSTNAAVAMKVYVPVTTTAYNSNPAAIINPTVAWTTDGDKTLYLQNTNTYDNAATVTGISKTATYTSSDATVATVSDAGVVTALKAGSTTITASVAKEIGVNNAASDSYVVTVKDASDIAGIKAITSSSSVVTFTADLTDAVVTYVKGNHAYIQDASGAIYASCGSSLTAGEKINGAVSGSVKAANQIDEITAIDLSSATVTDGVIPSAAVISAATLAANMATYEGKLVSIEGATVTASLANGSASGGKISDDSKVTEINLYAPDSNIDALKDGEGTFNGYISLYNGSTLRFNIYEQSQITMTKNAPTAQPLAFTSDAVELDEDTDDYDDFTGQTVSGAVGTVTYSIVSNDDEVVTSIDASIGAVVLSGNYGTATIKAAAAAKEVTEAGVTTPYTATEKTYTITVYPRYTVTFSVNGDETELRQASHGEEIEIPSPASIGNYVFRGWSTTTVATTDVAPSMTEVTNAPTADAKYYAVFALATGSPVVEHTSTFTIKQASAPSSPYVDDGSSWTWSNVTFQNDNNAKINSSDGSVTFTLPSGGKAKSLNITKTGNSWSGDASVVLEDASSNKVNTYTGSSLSFNFTEGTYDQSTSYTLSNSSSKNAWVEKIVFVYTTGGVTYSNYTTTISEVSAKLNSSGYATFACSAPLDFTDSEGDGYSAWQITAISGETITFSQITGTVAAGTGVLLKGTASSSINIPVAASGSDISGTNKLVGITSATAVTADQYYGLSGNQFMKVNAGTVPAGKALLPASEVGEARVLTFVFEDDETTGIKSMHNAEFIMHNEVYNLKGQRVEKPVKGQLYIVNGKKMIVK